MATAASVIRRAPLDVLEKYVKAGRPQSWTCNRCGYKNKLNKLRCENGGQGPSGICGGLGTRFDTTDSPEIYDIAKAELKRRRAKKGKKKAA